MLTPDELVLKDNWSDLERIREKPDIGLECLHAYRTAQLKREIRHHDVAMCVMVNPISLRYAINYRNYAAFMSHIPCTYLFYPAEGSFILHNGFEPSIPTSNQETGHPISYFYGGDNLDHFAGLLAKDVDNFLTEIGTSNRKVAVEYVNPSITLALAKLDIDVIDGVLITERARLIKSEDEVRCIRWAIAVAEHGIGKIKESLRPGVSELQLWGLLNYANLANDGDWHDGRMLASGPRTNPWFQEASKRKVESGDLVAFDTDMIGPMGYFADISRTLFCGPGKPSQRQKYLYRIAMQEIEHNLKLIKPGARFSDLQQSAFAVPEEFQDGAYPCFVHGVGMCDEYPHLKPLNRGSLPYDGTLECGMVLCIESYMGSKGERDGVKLEQQVLVTPDGYDLLTTLPYETDLA
ncbi:MAG: Xaa-Pro peptidase family protein [Gammaproteobacteria bacterium]|nr:Xaa-Pro peptidase family protein [Gammaproteobacteria bacterium]MCY4227887.1 Xaa-Pro peptidase family protein [Gammaproteobacteria bacterium]